MHDAFRGRNILIAGGGAGAGLELARDLAARGAALLLADQGSDDAGCSADPAAVQRAADSLGAIAFAAGTGSPDAAKAAVQAARARLGGLDALLLAPRLAAAGGLLAAPAWEAEAAFHRQLLQAYYLAAAAAPEMRAGGAILFVLPRGLSAAMAAAQWGLTGLVQALARELGGRGIRSNLLLTMPGGSAAQTATIAAWLLLAGAAGPDAGAPNGQCFLQRGREIWLSPWLPMPPRIARLESDWDLPALDAAARAVFSPAYQAPVQPELYFATPPIA